MKDVINILVTFDENYIKPFSVLLKSLKTNNPGEKFHIYLLHSQIPEENLQKLSEYCKVQKSYFTPIKVNRKYFENAKVTKQYPQEMYYRLLSPIFLPKNINRILYLDPDILVINNIRELWDLDLKENAFAAASHNTIFEPFTDVNKIRLGKNHDYFNTGVVLMDLEKGRDIVKPEEIFEYVKENALELVLPDQDVFNYLYGDITYQIDDVVWNYDVRYYAIYLMRSSGKVDMDWIMKNTVFLHFCGKQKPWKEKYTGKFAPLYKHYMNHTERF